MADPGELICPNVDEFTLTATLSEGAMLGIYDKFGWYEDDFMDPKNSDEISLTRTRNILEGNSDTYIARVEGCIDGETSSIVIFKATNSTQIGSISTSSGSNNICSGEEITLTASGGTTGIGSEIFWYSAANGGGALLGRGITLTQSPQINTTYYARREGCNVTEDRSITINVTDRPSIEFEEFPEPFICLGEEILFKAKNSVGADFSWNFGANANPLTQTGLGPHTVSYSGIGKKLIRLTVSQENCTLSITDSIDVFSKPSISLENIIEDTITVSESVQVSLAIVTDPSSVDVRWECEEIQSIGQLEGFERLDGTGAVISGIWTLAEKKNNDEALLRCRIIGELGACSDTVIQFIRIGRLLFIPNILSPNGDNLNETWGIQVNSDVLNPQDFDIELFNRQGVCVWGCGEEEANVALALDWSGENLPDGPYWYVISGPANFVKTGSLTIFRN